MLPDFVNVKQELAAKRASDLSANLFGDEVLSKMRHYRQHEGDRFTMLREDGTQSTSIQKELRSETVNFDLKSIQESGEQVIWEGFAVAHREIAAKGRRLLVQRLEEEPIPRVEGAGRAFTAELYLEALEAMELSFDVSGNWVEPDTWQEHPNPRLKSRIEVERKRLDDDPMLRQKLDDIINRKRKDWDVREANRKLVD